MKKLFRLFLFPAFVFLLAGCEDNTLWVGEYESIYLSYSKPSSASAPVVSLKKVTSFVDETGLNISAELTANDLIRINLKGVKVRGKKFPYTIENFSVTECSDDLFECNGKDWIDQSEFTSGSEVKKSAMSVILVLDMSQSIGNNITKLKSYAKTFITDLLQSNPDSEVGLILFSKNYTFYPFKKGDELSALLTAIDQYTDYQPQTQLYGSVQEGLNQLQNGIHENKVLVAFTDGGDNATDNPGAVVSSIGNSNIPRYSIGIKGDDFRRDVLQNVASNKTNIVVAKDYDDLSNVFSEINGLINSVYDIEYLRSAQVLPDDIYIRFKFRVKKAKG